MKKVFTLIISSVLVLNVFGQVNYLKTFKVGGSQLVNEDKINTNGHEYVDLGLSVLWATCNVGATNPEDYGDYFAWGEKTPKDNYSWDTYKYYKRKNESLTKYCTDSGNGYDIVGNVDNKITLDLEDDAANANWGGDWRMPTEEERNELCSKCTWTWMQKNGINGYQLTGPNGNSIFLPAAGHCYKCFVYNVGFKGRFWSSTLYSSDSNDAYFLNISSDKIDYKYRGERYVGQSVRPVLPKSVTLNNLSDTLFVDEECTLIASCSGIDIEAEWMSSNELVATVSGGVVKALSAGIATISAKYNGEKIDCEIIVKDKLAIVEISEPVYTNNDYTLIATYKGDTIIDPIWYSYNDAIATVSDNVLTALSAGTVSIAVMYEGETASSEILVIEPEYVDLGLSVLWATCNLGAATPEGHGDYFAWGETTRKSKFYFENYKYCKGYNDSYTQSCISKYSVKVDKKEILELTDDAANANWGGDWRMPTQEEQDDLRTKCNWIWTTQNGINGYKVVGPNGNSIFLPAAGYRNGTSIKEYGSYGRYWSSSLSKATHARSLSFNSSKGTFESNTERPIGLSIRPVLSKLLTLNTSSNALFVDEECTLNAYYNGQKIDAEWTSSNESVAIVSEGVIKALSAGITIISAKYNGEKVYCKITVDDKLKILSIPKLTYVNNEYTLKTTFKGKIITEVVWESSNKSIAKVSNGVVTALSAGTVTITATYEGETTSFEILVIEPEYVDLGLSVLWATCNVGAATPEAYGDYFAWGETTTKSKFYLDNYEHCKGYENSITKYCTRKYYGKVDKKSILELIDDAAYANLGGDWRMPTDDEQDDLKTKCNWIWTTQNGINGYKVVGPNGNSIFLPAAGYRNGTSIYEYGSYGRYWSSSLFLGRQADNMSFNSSIGPFWENADRPLGLSVRPVLPKSLTLNKLSNTLFVDEEYTLIATCNGKEVVPEWTSSNESVAIVSCGVVKALSAGKTTISAKYNGKKVDCTIIVNNKLTILSVPDPAYVNMNYKLKVTYGGDTISNALWTSSNIAVASVANGVLTALSAGSSILTATYNGEKAECKIVVIEPEYVDLGLSVKWATCNVGAINPEDFGDYFAWGETTPKSEYSWRTYKYCNGTANSMTKYCTNAENGIVDNKTTLELIDDAANVNLGGDWRVPTYKELEELVNDCSWKWTDKNGVKGYMITGPNCNSIFLPAAGTYYDYSIEYNTMGPYGIYYSSSLSSNDSHIKMMKIRVNDESVFSGVTTWDDYSRDVGMTIRPVLP